MIVSLPGLLLPLIPAKSRAMTAPETGQTKSARVYLNPNTGRFWTMDSEEGDNEDPISLHKYLYCSANPVDRIDPSGHDGDLVSLEVTADIEGSLSSMEGLAEVGAEATEEESLAASEAMEITEADAELGASESEVEDDIARTTLKQEGKSVRGLIEDVKKAKNLAKNIKVIPMPKSVIPAVCSNIKNGFLERHSPVLKRVNEETKVANRERALLGRKPAGVGYEWDEYPFASGAPIPASTGPATVAPVPWWQNRVQGGIIAGCYKIEKINVDTPYIVIIVP